MFQNWKIWQLENLSLLRRLTHSFCWTRQLQKLTEALAALCPLLSEGTLVCFFLIRRDFQEIFPGEVGEVAVAVSPVLQACLDPVDRESGGWPPTLHSLCSPLRSTGRLGNRQPREQKCMFAVQRQNVSPLGSRGPTAQMGVDLEAGSVRQNVHKRLLSEHHFAFL